MREDIQLVLDVGVLEDIQPVLDVGVLEDTQLVLDAGVLEDIQIVLNKKRTKNGLLPTLLYVQRV